MGPGRVSRTAAAACTSDVPVGGIRVVESIIREQNAEGWVGVQLLTCRVFVFRLSCFVFSVRCLGLLSLYTEGALCEK